jgi:hypothetical protein
MGCESSRAIRVATNSDPSPHLEACLANAVKEARLREASSSQTRVCFTRLLLQHGKMRPGFAKIKELFERLVALEGGAWKDFVSLEVLHEHAEDVLLIKHSPAFSIVTQEIAYDDRTRIDFEE